MTTPRSNPRKFLYIDAELLSFGLLPNIKIYNKDKDLMVTHDGKSSYLEDGIEIVKRLSEMAHDYKTEIVLNFPSGSDASACLAALKELLSACFTADIKCFPLHGLMMVEPTLKGVPTVFKNGQLTVYNHSRASTFFSDVEISRGLVNLEKSEPYYFIKSRSHFDTPLILTRAIKNKQFSIGRGYLVSQGVVEMTLALKIAEAYKDMRFYGMTEDERKKQSATKSIATQSADAKTNEQQLKAITDVFNEIKRYAEAANKVTMRNVGNKTKSDKSTAEKSESTPTTSSKPTLIEVASPSTPSPESKVTNGLTVVDIEEKSKEPDVTPLPGKPTPASKKESTPAPVVPKPQQPIPTNISTPPKAREKAKEKTNPSNARSSFFSPIFHAKEFTNYNFENFKKAYEVQLKKDQLKGRTNPKMKEKMDKGEIRNLDQVIDYCNGLLKRYSRSANILRNHLRPDNVIKITSASAPLPNAEPQREERLSLG